MVCPIEVLEKTLSDIYNVDPARGRSILSNYDDFIEKLGLMIKIKPVDIYLDIAEIYHFKKDKLFKKNSLFSARSAIKESNINDEDLRTAALVDYPTRNTLTLEGVEQRLTALEWKGWHYYNSKIKI